MLKNEVSTQTAYILHTEQSGEADRILTIFTKEMGILKVFAKSIREIKSKLKHGAIPYRKCSVSIINGNQYILKDVIDIDELEYIWSDKSKIDIYVSSLRLLKKTVLQPEIREVGIFNALDELVSSLSDSSSEDIMLSFKIKLFEELGYLDGLGLDFPNTFQALGDTNVKKDMSKKVNYVINNGIIRV